MTEITLFQFENKAAQAAAVHGEEASRSQVFVTPKGMANLALQLQQN
ncbi:MAG: hypothetical protein SOH81_07810 [Acetobacter sp.]